jgi:anaerobic magnesium-protoporphyrin IX monomethyl ester cyclase
MSNKVVLAFHTSDYEYNLGVGFLSACLQKNGIETDLVIYREMPGKPSDTAESVASLILSKKPAIVAFSVMTFNWHRIKPVISILREQFDGPVIAGGYHAILSPEEVLAYPGIDAVCTGEGERPMLEFIKHLPLSKSNPPAIEGIAFKGQFRDEAAHGRWLVERLEDYPFVDYDIFAAEGDLRQKHLGPLSPGGIFSLPVITGRGCPFRCTYCSNSALIEHYRGVKRFVRRYPPEVAVRNVKGLAEKYRPDFFEFMDETFAMNKTWVEEFCLHYRREVGTPFLVMSRIDLIDEQTVSLLVESGLRLFLFGLESGDENYRSDYLNRKMTNEVIIRGAKILKKYGVLIGTFNIFGMPFETKETIQNTIALNSEIQPDAAIPFIYQPLPGTKLAKMAYDNGMVREHPEGTWDFCVSSLDTPELPASYVVEQADGFRARFSSPGQIQALYDKLRKVSMPDITEK